MIHMEIKVLHVAIVLIPICGPMVWGVYIFIVLLKPNIGPGD